MIENKSYIMHFKVNTKYKHQIILVDEASLGYNFGTGKFDFVDNIYCFRHQDLKSTPMPSSVVVAKNIIHCRLTSCQRSSRQILHLGKIMRMHSIPIDITEYLMLGKVVESFYIHTL